MQNYLTWNKSTTFHICFASGGSQYTSLHGNTNWSFSWWNSSELQLLLSLRQKPVWSKKPPIKLDAMLKQGLEDCEFKVVWDNMIILVYVDNCILILKNKRMIAQFIDSLTDVKEKLFTADGSIEKYIDFDIQKLHKKELILHQLFLIQWILKNNDYWSRHDKQMLVIKMDHFERTHGNIDPFIGKLGYPPKQHTCGHLDRWPPMQLCECLFNVNSWKICQVDCPIFA